MAERWALGNDLEQEIAPVAHRFARGAGPDPDPDPDLAVVTALLGRQPRADFAVVVRDRHGVPVVVRNAPFERDGTPMPTLYWLVGRREHDAVSRLEARGGVVAAAAAIDPEMVASAHVAYATERESYISPGHDGPRPSGGVAGTRVGTKCLHAHYAWFLAGGDDPVGGWVHDQLIGEGYDTNDANETGRRIPT